MFCGHSSPAPEGPTGLGIALSVFFFESSPSDFGFESRKANQARTMSKTCQPSVFTIFLEIPGLETDR